MASSQGNQDSHEPLLTNYEQDTAVSNASGEDEIHVTFPSLVEESWRQAGLAWPVALNQISMYAICIISMVFVGHLGETELAAASLGNSLVGIASRTLLWGMCGALDTLAAQAYGAQCYRAIGACFQKTVIFLWLHCIPLSGFLLAIPYLMSYFAAEGAELGNLTGQYILYQLPVVWLDSLARPLNSVLVAQCITKPQMVVAVVTIPLHIATNYLLIHVAGLGLKGAALSLCIAQAYNVLLTVGYVLVAKISHRVWGKLGHGLDKGWGQLACLAYPSGGMRCAESWGFSIVTVAAGFLRNPETAVAALGIAFSCMCFLFMVFVAFSMTACAAVGNALGAGQAAQAKTAALTFCLIVPTLWILFSILLLEPHCANIIYNIFTSNPSERLHRHVMNLFAIVTVLVFCDGAQVMGAGVIQGLGQQRHGFLVNFISFYCLAIPVAMLLGFYSPLPIPFSYVEGMYIGMILGPATQMVSFAVIIARTRWSQEARLALQKMEGSSMRRQESACCPIVVAAACP